MKRLKMSVGQRREEKNKNKSRRSNVSLQMKDMKDGIKEIILIQENFPEIKDMHL